MEDLRDKIIEEEKEYEKAVRTMKHLTQHPSFTIMPTKLFKNKYYLKWQASAHAMTGFYLFGCVIRAPMKNKLANYIYQKYYIKKKILPARYTQESIAKELGYKDRRAVNNHMSRLSDEGIFIIHEDVWNGRAIKIYDFGTWKIYEDRVVETIRFIDKFKKIQAEEKLNSFR